MLNQQTVDFNWECFINLNITKSSVQGWFKEKPASAGFVILVQQDVG